MTTHAAFIAIYIHDLSGGGVERQALKLAAELQNVGLRVELVLHSLDGDLQSSVADDLPVYDLRSRRTLGDVPRLATYLRTRQPDVLLANVDHNNVAALMAKALTLNGPTKTIICQHNALSPAFAAQGRWTYRLVPAAYRILAPFAAAAVAVSSGIAEEIKRVIPAQKVQVIHNGVIGDDFEARAAAPASHPWLVRHSGKLFVTAGRLVPQKDHVTLLRAFERHLRHRSDSRLMILGSGPLRQPLEDLCSDLRISDSVAFLGFQVNPLPFMRQADCFVLSSNSEGFGNVLVEALGCGTPVISTDCPHGPAEILDRGRYGVLVPPAADHQLAIAMDRIDHMRARWPQGVLQARAAEFTDHACAVKYASLFKMVLSGAHAGHRLPARQMQL